MRHVVTGVCMGLLLLAGCGDKSASPTFTIKGSTSAAASATSMFSPLLRVMSGAATGSPATMKMNFYGVYASLNENCSSPVEVFTSTDPLEFDMTQSPTLFSGALADGTYKCIALRVSDNIVFKPDAAAAAAWPLACSVGVENTHDIYRADNTISGEEFRDIDGTTVTPRGTGTSAVSDTVVLLATTSVAAARAAGFAEYQVLGIPSALVVPGDQVFYSDFTNGIEDTGDNLCRIEGGTGFGFR